MATRVEVSIRPELTDARGDGCQREIREFLHLPVKSVRTLNVYTVDLKLDGTEVAQLAGEGLSDPVTQLYAIGEPLAPKLGVEFDWALEVGYLPGVTDNEGRTAKEAAEMLLSKSFPHERTVYTGVQYLITGGDLARSDVERMASDFLANGLIQRWEILSVEEFRSRSGFSTVVPRVCDVGEPKVVPVDLEVSDEELVRISKEGLLALTLGEMQVIRDYYRDPVVHELRASKGLPTGPTDVELECLAQTWSEHCKHKIFNATIDYNDGTKTERIESIFKTFIMGSTARIREEMGERDICLSVFKDNAGVITFNDDWSLCFKVETHNSPSALDPYGGALTGIVGVNRDPMGTGMGARLVFNVDTFCFADPHYEAALPPRLLHPRRIYEGVVTGVEHGGNKSGIPTVNGTIVFDDRFLGKPLVFCGTAGLIPAKVAGHAGYDKKAEPGDLIVMAGGRVGKDGIHGATFSSEELHEGSPATAVQLGDPITQKRLYDFLLVAQARSLFSSVTDNGAGGLSSSVGEMAEQSGGARLQLEKAPLKYPGLNPWEILVSESQERMTFAVPPEKIEEFIALAEKMRVEATVMGEFTAEPVFNVRFGDETVAWLEMKFLHDGLPEMVLNARWTPPTHTEPDFETPADLTIETLKLLGRLNICSKEAVVRRYDHEVQGGSVVKPFVGVTNDGPSDAAVVRPLLDTFAGVVTANGICPRYSDIDAYHMMACAVDEAVRNAVCVGASLDHLAGLDNFCWCDPVQSDKTPDGEYKLAQLVRANQALYDLTVAYGVPLISGKDSMKNDYHIGDTKISIPPTVLFSVIGRIADVRKCVTMDAKRDGDLVYVLGVTRDELGGSEYYAAKHTLGNAVPKVDTKGNLALYRAMEMAVAEGLVASAHDCSDGGLAVALAESGFSGGLGIECDLAKAAADSGLRDDALIFSESQGRIVVTVRPDAADRFEACFSNLPANRVGRVTGDERLVVKRDGRVLVDAANDELKAAWQQPLSRI